MALDSKLVRIDRIKFSAKQTGMVKVHIRSLRQKLKVAGAMEDLIETVHNMGYRLKQSDWINAAT